MGLDLAEVTLTAILDNLNQLAENHTVNVTYTSIKDANGSLDTFKKSLEDINDKTYSANITVAAHPTKLTIAGDGQSISFSITAAAHGGLVKSAAGGTIEPGLALTGELAPEIVWNADKGYAYLAGKNGPEINLL